jgi:F0F1-type ATP synthase epsilon subunit
MVKQLLHVRISNPEKQLWEGDAESVSSVNTTGPFDILPMHTNFISYLKDTVIKIKTPEKMEEFKFTWSVIYTHNNIVNIYTNI